MKIIITCSPRYDCTVTSPDTGQTWEATFFVCLYINISSHHFCSHQLLVTSFILKKTFIFLFIKQDTPAVPWDEMLKLKLIISKIWTRNCHNSYRNVHLVLLSWSLRLYIWLCLFQYLALYLWMACHLTGDATTISLLIISSQLVLQLHFVCLFFSLNVCIHEFFSLYVVYIAFLAVRSTANRFLTSASTVLTVICTESEQKTKQKSMYVRCIYSIWH